MTETETARPRSYRVILRSELAHGLLEIERPAGGLLFSGLSAGLDLGFSVLLMAVVASLAEGQLPPVVVHLLMANMYAVGFIFVVLGRSELFTEHTTLAVFPVLGGLASVRALGRLWGLVYAANLMGAAAFAALMVVVAPRLGVVEPEAFGHIARIMVGHAWWVVLLSAVLAGWLMGLMSWLVAAGRDTISQLLFVWIVAAAIGLGNLHHSIVGTVEVLGGVFSRQGITLVDFGHFLLWCTLGNALGGVIFVALVKYGHAVRSEPEEDDAARRAAEKV